jgi:type VI secretion system protein ImpH
MAIITWRQNPAVIEALSKEAANFEFEQAVTILEQEQANSTTLGEGSDPLAEALQIKSHVSLANPSASLHKLERKTGKKATLWINFLSLAGIQGPLPTPYTELLMQRTRQKDFAFRDFLDIFNHRLASLWYRLRKKHKVSLSPVKTEQHPLGKTLLQLIGVTDPAAFAEENQSVLNHRILLTYSDLLWKRPRSAAGLVRLIESYFQVPVKLDLFQGKWHEAPPGDLSYLGQAQGQYNALGQTMILGQKVWDQASSVTMTLGPLSWEQCQSFLPTTVKGAASHFKTLQALCNFYTQGSVHLKVCLVLKDGEAKPVILNKQYTLGLNCWLAPQGNNNQECKVFLGNIIN